MSQTSEQWEWEQQQQQQQQQYGQQQYGQQQYQQQPPPQQQQQQWPGQGEQPAAPASGGFGGDSGPSRVYVGNLSWDVDWQALKDHMGQVGEVTFCEVMTEGGGRSKGCGYVDCRTLLAGLPP
jgi:hypothetical protein